MKDNMGYVIWWNKANALVEAKLGVSLLDLPDMPFRDWFDDGKSPAFVAAKAVKMAKEDF